ncbi:sensor histidine kinase [Humidisolicoccus flavus]|uniref:sensor histidine kinase n=1 Tax=Humidisolicoccus flavus TaxID=3111414 RepID=UPI0032525939
MSNAGARKKRFSLGFPAHLSLRKRILFVLIALLLLLSFGIGSASVASMRFVLEGRVDEQVKSFADNVSTAIARGDARIELSPGVLYVDSNPNVQSVYAPGFYSSKEVVSMSDRAHVLEDCVSSATYPQDCTLTEFGHFRVMSIPISTAADGSVLRTVVVGISTAETNQTLGQLAFVIVISALAATMFAYIIGDAVLRRALRPLTEVVATAERISALPLDEGEVQLSARVPVEARNTEVGRVGTSMNRMLNHIESSLESRAASERKVRQFVADASHELRTPLASIKGYAEITRKHQEGLSEDSRVSLERISMASERMTALVNDLLLLARLDEGRELERDTVDLSYIVVEAVADAQAAGPSHRIDLELPEEPIEIRGDRLRVQQVVANLLANARIHTPEGTGISVSLTSNGSSASVQVQDRGEGIPEDIKATLFERFVRGDQSRSRVAGSSGLGLSIVKAIVEAHEGEISVESRPGDTRFLVTLPLASPEGAARTAPR